MLHFSDLRPRAETRSVQPPAESTAPRIPGLTSAVPHADAPLLRCQVDRTRAVCRHRCRVTSSASHSNFRGTWSFCGRWSAYSLRPRCWPSNRQCQEVHPKQSLELTRTERLTKRRCTRKLMTVLTLFLPRRSADNQPFLDQDRVVPENPTSGPMHKSERIRPPWLPAAGFGVFLDRCFRVSS